MTLKEKFINVLKQAKIHFIKFDAEECEKIADDYAIEFLNYYLHNKANSRYIFSNLSAEEALKIFKKERGW